MEHGFSWVTQIPGLMLLEPHTSTALLVMVLLLLFAFAPGSSWRPPPM
jgi:cell division protein FtsW (lipid II flippase)